MGLSMNIAVVDGGGHLIAFARMDKAILGSIDIALAKAKTSILFNGPSENLWECCKPGGLPGQLNTRIRLDPLCGWSRVDQRGRRADRGDRSFGRPPSARRGGRARGRGRLRKPRQPGTEKGHR